MTLTVQTLGEGLLHTSSAKFVSLFLPHSNPPSGLLKLAHTWNLLCMCPVFKGSTPPADQKKVPLLSLHRRLWGAAVDPPCSIKLCLSFGKQLSAVTQQPNAVVSYDSRELSRQLDKYIVAFPVIKRLGRLQPAKITCHNCQRIVWTCRSMG